MHLFPASRPSRLVSSFVLAMVALTAIWSSKAFAADVSVSVEFHDALQPYGQWSHHDRWGDVWIPVAARDKDWSPYTRGRWVYTDDWGWYWASDQNEAEWGWAAYHYGRWFYDPQDGWVWIPGREWAPAWVTWRHGGHRVGWAPQPPDEIYVEIRDNPRFWVFVEGRNFNSDRIWTDIEPGWHQNRLLQETVIVNRTVVIRDRGPIIAVNQGIEPGFIAREIGEPIHTYDVHPVVIAGSANMKDAIKVSPAQKEKKVTERVVERSDEVVKPAETAEPPKALGADETGHLGSRPPKAAAGEVAPEETKGAEKEGDRKPKASATEQDGGQGGANQAETNPSGTEEKATSKAAEENEPEKKGQSGAAGPEQPSAGAETENPAKAAKGDEKTKPGNRGKSAEHGGSEPSGPALQESSEKAAKGDEKTKPGNRGKSAEQGGSEPSGPAAEIENPGKAAKGGEKNKPGNKGKSAEQGGSEHSGPAAE